MTSSQLRMVEIAFLVLGLTMLPIHYSAQVTTQSKTDEAFNWLNSLKTRITKVRKYSLNRNDVELVARKIEEASKMLTAIRQSNKRPASFKNLSLFSISD